jgi:hypothetical protein
MHYSRSRSRETAPAAAVVQAVSRGEVQIDKRRKGYGYTAKESRVEKGQLRELESVHSRKRVGQRVEEAVQGFAQGDYSFLGKFDRE